MAADVASVLQGIHPDYQHEWLKTRWIQHLGGFKLLNGTTLPQGMRPSNSNPRHTGKWILNAQHTVSTFIVASDYVACNGKMECSKSVNGSCSVKLRITYFGDATCRLYAEGPSVSHGLAFVPDRKILPMSTRTKDAVESYAFLIRPNLRPSNVRRILLSQNPQHKDDRSIVPTIPQISDHIAKLRARKRRDLWGCCDELQSEFPEQVIHFPTGNDSPKFIVLRGTSRLFLEFSKKLAIPNVWLVWTLSSIQEQSRKNASLGHLRSE